MSKGFVFTFDAMLAIIVIIIMAAALVITGLYEGTDTTIFENIRTKAIDESTVAFYLNKPASGSASGSYVFCSKHFTYSYGEDIKPVNSCEGIQ